MFHHFFEIKNIDSLQLKCYQMTLTIRSISLSIFNSNKPTDNKNNLLFRQMRYKNEAKASPRT